MNTKTIILDGSMLTPEDIERAVHDPKVKVQISPKAVEIARRAKKFLDQEADKKIIYGVNTGFGPMASHIIGRSDVIALQENLIRGHAMGMGEPLPQSYVLAAMIVRLNTLAKGHSGVSVALLQHLELFINHRIIPVVPEHGAVGTSGDLVQLAHIALALIGGGEAWHGGARQSVSNILKKLRIAPHKLQPKEGLSLINGTSMMAGIASLACMEAERLVSASLRTGALSLELVGAFDDAISEELHKLRPHPGQQAVARILRELLVSSRLLRNREAFQKKFLLENKAHVISESVQEIYSLRCIPQVVGPVLDILKKVKSEVVTEINSVTDNPVIDGPGKRFLHGGNFHGDYIAAGMDQLKASLVKLTMLSERRINFFLNQNINKYFPPMMNLKTPGLTMGLQGLQFVATSTTSQSQTFAFPQHVHSIPTNGDNQDIVSMGTDAALLTMRVIENAYVVLTIEALTLAQGVDFKKEQAKLSAASRKFFEVIRRAIPTVREDRSLAPELPRLSTAMREYDILKLFS